MSFNLSTFPLCHVAVRIFLRPCMCFESPFAEGLLHTRQCARCKASLQCVNAYILPNILTAILLRIKGMIISLSPYNKSKDIKL